jgi:hypothetical protein
MIEVEDKITSQILAILIDSRASHSYIDPKLVDRFHLKKSNLEIPRFVQQTVGTKRRINDIFRSCPIDLNGVNTIIDLNIIMLGSNDILIGMDWLDMHHVSLVCHNKTFTCLGEKRKHILVKGIPRLVSIREFQPYSSKDILQKNYQLFAFHVKEPTKNKSSKLEYFVVLQEFEGVFGEISCFLPKRDINFSIDLMLGVAPISKTPYRMNTPELKELQMQLEELLKKWYIRLLNMVV